MTMNENDKQAEPVGEEKRLEAAGKVANDLGVKTTDAYRIIAAYTHPAQPVQPVGAQGEPVAWMFSRRYGKGLDFKRPPDSEDEDGNVTEPIPLYTAPPAAAINEQLLEALENLALACGRNDGWEDYPQEMKAANAAIAAAEAEKAKGGE